MAAAIDIGLSTSTMIMSNVSSSAFTLISYAVNERYYAYAVFRKKSMSNENEVPDDELEVTELLKGSEEPFLHVLYKWGESELLPGKDEQKWNQNLTDWCLSTRFPDYRDNPRLN